MSTSTENVSNKKKEKRSPVWLLGAIAAFLKLGKFGGVIISMIISIGFYAMIAPWQFAIGLVLMIFVHEMGHVIAARIKGLPVTAPVFIPFMGALINMKKHPRDAETEAFIAMGGPVLGSIGAVVVFYVGLHYHSSLLLGIAYTGFFINLLNLLPIHPLDGGRIATAISRWLWLLGLVGGLVVIIYIKSILFFIIWALFAWDMYIKYVKNKGRGSIRNLPVQFELPVDQVLSYGGMIPGENHQRPLPFRTFSELEGAQIVELRWDSIGLNGAVKLPEQGLIQHVQVVKVERNQNETEGQQVVISIMIKYEAYEAENYYEVSPLTRFTYGTAYGVLAATLLYFLYWIHSFA